MATRLAVIAATLPSATFADFPLPPHSYKQMAPGGKYVFVMLGPRIESDMIAFTTEPAAQPAVLQEIRRAYARSGMYRNDGSAEPIWTVDWYAQVKLAADGVHLIRYGPWAGSIDDEALSFVANGTLLRTYLIRELVGNPRLLDWSVSHFLWLEQDYFDTPVMEYTLTTKDRNRFTFNVRTGEIISNARLKRPPTRRSPIRKWQQIRPKW